MREQKKQNGNALTAINSLKFNFHAALIRSLSPPQSVRSTSIMINFHLMMRNVDGIKRETAIY